MLNLIISYWMSNPVWSLSSNLTEVWFSKEREKDGYLNPITWTRLPQQIMQVLEAK